MTVNLRGVRESGTIFALPTYMFIGTALLLVGVGLARTLLGAPPHVTDVTPLAVPPQTLGVLLLGRAFADGCSAMTGTEAVANGVPAFKPPEWRNAQATMAVVARPPGGDVPRDQLPRPGQRGDAGRERRVGAVPDRPVDLRPEPPLLRPPVLDDGHPHPGGQHELRRLPAALLDPRSGRLLPPPVRLSRRAPCLQRRDRVAGPRLDRRPGRVRRRRQCADPAVRHRGVHGLHPVAVGHGPPLVHVERGPGWRRSAVINGVGADVTAIITVIFAIAKFALGAWIILVIVPVFVVAMLFVHRQYAAEARELEVRPQAVIPRPTVQPGRRRRCQTCGATRSRRSTPGRPCLARCRRRPRHRRHRPEPTSCGSASTRRCRVSSCWSSSRAIPTNEFGSAYCSTPGPAARRPAPAP